MRLSRTELMVLEQIAKGNRAIIMIAKALKRSDKQVYVTARRLEEKGILNRKRGRLEPKRIPYIALLLQLLSEHPNLCSILSGSGIPILTELLKPSTIEEISSEAGVKRGMVYRKLREANNRSILVKKKKSFSINDKIWRKLRSFLDVLKEYEQTIDKRIPASSTIYYKRRNEIIFSCREECNATRTAFSAYEKHGIKLMLTKYYYHLPKKQLSKEEILKHSLYVVEKDMSIRNLIFLALFYAKFRKSFGIRHEILINLDIILSRGEVEGYPSFDEVKERAELYGIEIDDFSIQSDRGTFQED